MPLTDLNGHDNSDGSFSFDPTNSAYDSLADGQSEVITVNYQVNDGDSGTSDVQSFDITVLGTNDAPTTTADVLDAWETFTEGDALIAGQLKSSDLDNNATASYSLIGAAIPGLTINSDGSWSFNPADSAYNDLSEGDIKTITVNYSVTDDQNAVDTGSFNDQPDGYERRTRSDIHDRSQCAGRRY